MLTCSVLVGMQENCDILYSRTSAGRFTDGRSILLYGNQCWEAVLKMGNHFASLGELPTIPIIPKQKEGRSLRLSDYQVITMYPTIFTTHHKPESCMGTDMEIWSRGLGVVHCKVPKKYVDEFLGGVNYTVLHEDLQVFYDQSKVVPYYGAYNLGDGNAFYKEVRSYGDQKRRMNALCRDHSSICTEFVAGKTAEGRKIHAVSIEGGTGGWEIVYNGNLDAIEWISPMTTLYILEKLITQYDSNANVKELVDKFKWTIITVPNGANGRLFESGSRDPQWKSNRRTNDNTTPPGCELTRDYDYHWWMSRKYPLGNERSRGDTQAMVKLGLQENCDVIYSKMYSTWHFTDGGSILLTGDQCWDAVLEMGNYLASLPPEIPTKEDILSFHKKNW